MSNYMNHLTLFPLIGSTALTRRKVFGANKCGIMKGRHLDRANNPLILQFIRTDIKARQYMNAVRLGQEPLDSEAKL